jgi:hypothetical protein
MSVNRRSTFIVILIALGIAGAIYFFTRPPSTPAALRYSPPAAPVSTPNSSADYKRHPEPEGSEK